MKKLIFISFLLSTLLSIFPFRRAQAQVTAAKATSVIPWFAVKNNAMVVQTGENVEPPSKDVTLPNGIRVEHLTHSVILTKGSRVKLK